MNLNSVPPSDASTTNRRLTAGLIIALLAWGIVLAVGAIWFNNDVRKGVIVLGCSLAFLTLWAVAMTVLKNRNRPTTGERKNWLCVTAAVNSVVAMICMLLPLTGLLSPAAPAYRMVLLVSQLLLVTTTLFALIGLSDVARPLWKWLGLLSLVIAVVTIAIGFAVPPAASSF